MGDHISSPLKQHGLLGEQTTSRNKNVHFHHPQKQRTTPSASQSSGSSSALLSPCSDLRQDFVPRRRHPRTLHDRTEDGEEGVTAWRSGWGGKRENSFFDVLFYTWQCNQMQTS